MINIKEKYSLEEVVEQVTQEQSKKSDTLTLLKDWRVGVDSNGKTKLENEEKLLYINDTGLSSFLEKIKVPKSFYNRCSPELKREIADEHFKKTPDSLVRFRTYEDQLRYIGSEKYAVFDDIDVLNSLLDLPKFNSLCIREFYQTPTKLILRTTWGDAITDGVKRPFIPGVQITNSEVGQGSVSVSFFLWEQVCTNGLIVSRDRFAKYRRAHLGSNKDNSNLLRESCNLIITALPTFAEEMRRKLVGLNTMNPDVLFQSILNNHTIPDSIKATMENTVLRYEEKGKETAIDILSAFTDSIQRLNWDQRLQLEEVAGNLLMSA